MEEEENVTNERGSRRLAAGELGGFWRGFWNRLKTGGWIRSDKETVCRHHLHLGAHKTGTTFCQTVLKINKGKLTDRGICYWDLKDTRRDLTPYFIGLSEKKGSRTPEECLARLSTVLGSQEAKAATRLVISDENLTGFIKDILRKRGYRGLKKRMSAIRDALGRDVKVYFTVRDYADFISSMYCEYVVTKHYFPFDDVRQGRFAAELSWVKVYDVLAKVFGRRNVVVFEYGKVFKNLPAHLSCLVGTEVDFEIPRKQIRASPSAKAIEYIGRESTANPETPVMKIAARAVLLHPRNAENPPFDPWTPAERAALDERYRRDLARIPCWSPAPKESSAG